MNLTEILSSKYLIGLLLLISLSVAGYYIYHYQIKKTLETNVSPKDEQEATVVMFGVGWCPHSKKTKPIYDSLSDSLDGKNYKNTNTVLHFNYVDCDENKEEADKFGIESYPTIKLISPNKEVIDYESSLKTESDKEKFHEFLTQIL